MKRVKGEGIVRYSKFRNQDAHVRKHEHMGGSGLIGFLQILRLEAEGHPGLREQFWELARAASDTRDMPKDIATQMAGILPWLRVTTGCRYNRYRASTVFRRL